MASALKWTCGSSRAPCGREAGRVQALKCYLFALEAAKNSPKYAHVVPSILNNIAALQPHGHLDLALEHPARFTTAEPDPVRGR